MQISYLHDKRFFFNRRVLFNSFSAPIMDSSPIQVICFVPDYLRIGSIEKSRQCVKEVMMQHREAEPQERAHSMQLAAGSSIH